MIKACIFDLDGTLADTIESLVYSVGKTLEEMGLSAITKEQCRCFVGNGAKVLLDKSIRKVGDANGERLDEAMEIYRRIFDENCTYHVSPYEGITETLKRLRRNQVKLAVLSNKPHRQTVKVTEAVFGEEIFDVILGQQEGISRKPSPEGLYAVLEKLKAAKEESLYVGDSEVDIATGAAAGIHTVSVTWGFRTQRELEESGAGHLIHRPEELLDLL